MLLAWNRKTRWTPSVAGAWGDRAMTAGNDGRCSHPGGFRSEDGRWECSRCGHLFDSYEAWGAETGNEAAVAAVKAVIAADLADMQAKRSRPESPP